MLRAQLALDLCALRLAFSRSLWLLAAAYDAHLHQAATAARRVAMCGAWHVCDGMMRCVACARSQRHRQSRTLPASGSHVTSRPGGPCPRPVRSHFCTCFSWHRQQKVPLLENMLATRTQKHWLQVPQRRPSAPTKHRVSRRCCMHTPAAFGVFMAASPHVSGAAPGALTSTSHVPHASCTDAEQPAYNVRSRGTPTICCSHPSCMAGSVGGATASVRLSPWRVRTVQKPRKSLMSRPHLHALQ
jgi:hypothetical protein